MNLRKRAISGIMLAGSMVVMCAIADAASTVSAEAVAVVADTRTDLATDGTAGVVAQLNPVPRSAVFQFLHRNLYKKFQNLHFARLASMRYLV